MKNNSHKRLKRILKREKQIPEDIKTLFKKLKDAIHGNMGINTEKLKELINLTISETPLQESKVEDVKISNLYSYIEEENSQSLKITIPIKGSFTGKIHIETGAGTNTKYYKPIYYVHNYSSKITSDLEVKILNYYKNTYKTILEENFLNIAINHNLYLDLKTHYNNYELWHCNPSSYENTMTGDYNKKDIPSCNYAKNSNLNKLSKFDNFKDFIESDYCGWHTEQVEWRVYNI